MKTFSDNTRYSYVKALVLIHSLWLMFITLKYHVQEASLKKMNDSISDLNGNMVKDIMEEVRREINMIQLQQVVEVQDKKKNDHSFVSRQQTQHIKDTRSKIYSTKGDILKKPSSLIDYDRNKDVKENKSGVNEIEIPSSHDKYNNDKQKRNLNQIDLDMILERDNHISNTSCFLVNEINMTMMSYSHDHHSMVFDLRMNIKTDGKPDQSWTLTPQHGRNNEISIDSKSHISTSPNNMKPHTLHSFDYKCFVHADETNQKKDHEPICYDFEIYSEFQFVTEYCCELGIDHFTVSVNNNTVLSDRLYGRSLTASFCLNDDGKLMNEETEVITPVERFPSRACVGEKCICDSNPFIVNFHEAEDRMHKIKMNTLTKMMLLSGSEKLRDVETPQYKAACWVLNDDPFFHQQQSEPASMSSKRSENRMLQRYILALFYFATSPEQWNNHYHFLSSRSECTWNSRDEFYNGTIDTMRGVLCDADENVFSINLFSNNLKGTIIDEIFGFEKLEQLILRSNKDLYGPIPSSLGTLSELRDLTILENSVQGSIPPELFEATKIQRLVLRKINLTGTIPNNINNLHLLSLLELSWSDNLTGILPEEIFMLDNLVHINLYGNRLSGTISQSLSDWKKLEYLALDGNKFSGTLPSTLRDMSRLRYAYFDNNNLSGNVPDFSTLQHLETIWLHENNFVGDLSDQCDSIFEEGTYDETYGSFDLLGITADCHNDVFQPNVVCSCCSYCTDESPIWNGGCGDTILTIEIDTTEKPEEASMYWVPMYGAIWSLEDDSRGQTVFSAGPFSVWTATAGYTFKTCITKSIGCFSMKTKVPSKEDRNFTIYLDNDPIYNGTFMGYENNDDISPDTARTVVSFKYDAKIDKMRFDDDTLCSNIQMICDGNEIIIYPNTIYRTLYTSVMKISQSEKFQDVSSNHLKSLCWLFKHENYEVDDENDDFFLAKFTQRYVLTLLHLESKDGLFGVEEYPPRSHECTWLGVSCKDSTQIVTGLSLGDNQTMDGTLVKELGSLAYLEKLILSRSFISGTIPLEYSNFWRLIEFDLSENKLNGTISDNFFSQLEWLELFDLSNNDMSGTIPTNIGSYSNIKTIRLKNNRFTGELPLDGFLKFNLKHLDVSNNTFSGSISTSLLKHRNLEHLDLGTNFFVGSIEKSILDDLTKLKHFDVSQNELMGAIPPLNHNVSNITFFDMRANRITGTLPISLVGMSSLKYLNLQGNKITGSIPFELNNLENLHTLVLSHNKLKGSIPITFDKLSKLNIFQLHTNQLSGKAPMTDKKIKSYITDCGYPSASSDPIDCPSCTICCNSDNLCAKQRETIIGPVLISCIFILSLLSLMVFIYAVKQRIINADSISKRFERSVTHWQASETIGDKSVYHFFLTPSVEGWFIGLFCAIAQLATLFLFITSADIKNEKSDLKYTVTCPANSLECDDKNSLSVFGYFIFALILFGWLTKDMIASIKLFMLALWKKNIDFFFASMILFLVTSLSIWTSAYYNIAIATKDTELIVYSVILLFVNELDERLFLLVQTCNLSFANAVEESIKRASYHEGRELNVTRGLNKVRKRLISLSSSIVGVSSDNSNLEKKKDSMPGNPTNLDVERDIEKRDMLLLCSDSIVESSEKSFS